MKFELFVALRYLRARRKQAFISLVTLISVVGVAAGVVALNVALSLNTGLQEEFRKRILGATSHVNLVGVGGSSIENYQTLLPRLLNSDGVVSGLPTIYGQALLQGDLRQEPAVLKGIEFANQGELEQFFSNLQVIEGSLEGFDVVEPTPPIILGKELANTLAVSSGEVIRAFGLEGQLTPFGRAPRMQNFSILAIFESGLWEIDAHWALIPVSSAQDFFSLGSDEVSALEFRITDIDSAPQFANEIKRRAGPGFSVNTWIELNRPLFSALRLEKLAMSIAIGLIVLVASLNIVSTLTMMVMEKNRDIAIISAMGGTKSTITRVFMLQGLMIGALGTLLGDVTAAFLIRYFDANRTFELDPQVYSIPYVPFSLSGLDMLVVSVVAISISFLATLHPARSASRLDPVEALRYE